MAQKVLFTASTLSHIRSFHLPYLLAFRQRGWITHAACGGAGELEETDRLISLPFCKKMTAPENFKAARLLRKLILQERYDLIITHTSLAAFFTRLATKGMANRPRMINVAHGYLFDDSTPPLKRTVLLTAEKVVAPQTDLLLTMNAYDDTVAHQKRLGKRICMIPGVGVDFAALDAPAPVDAQALRRQMNISEDAFVFLYAAEFSARKNQVMLLHAMKYLPQNAVLVLAGNGTERDACITLAKEMGLEHRVVFPGHVSPMSAWYGMADAVVSSSRSEGLPFNIMEAVHCKLPVVASAIKGHTDLITDGVTGLLYPYDDAKQCAAQMAQLMNDPALCASLGDAASRAVAPYGLDIVLPQVMEQYLSL